MDYTESTLYDFIEHRLDIGRDAKIIITAGNSETGVGKTTFAIIMAMVHDRNGFTAEKEFQSGIRYMEYYADTEPGDVLLIDDFMSNADSRRGTSRSNVRLSQFWQHLRHKNVVTIVTLPSISMLDRRFKELADIRINIKHRGLAIPYRIVIHDIEQYIREKNWLDENGEREIFEFEPIDDFEIYQKIEKKKERYTQKQIEKWKGDD